MTVALAEFASQVMPWTKHVRAGRDLIHQAFETANKTGDVTFAAYSCLNLNTNLLAAGDPLVEVQREVVNGLEFAQGTGLGLAIDVITAQLSLIRTLRGSTPKFGSFDDEHFDELRFECHLSGNPALAYAEGQYWIRKLQARFFAGDWAGALEASSKAQRLLWTSASIFETAEYHFYAALAHAASCDSRLSEPQQQHLEALAVHERQLDVWAEDCPENFENRGALVSAEIARIEGRHLEAMRLYERAIQSARANGFVHNEALGNEIAGRFYAGLGFERIARAYFQDARHGYLRWGADAKVRQLDLTHPHLREPERAPAPTSTSGASVESLDLATVLKFLQDMAGELVLDRMVDTLMRTAIQHAGAGRGLLIVARDDEHRILAEGTTSRDTVTVSLREAGVSAADLPESVLHYVVRTKDCILLHDAAGDERFAADQYIQLHHARSILCLPLLKGTRLTGVLYFENNLAPDVFTASRMVTLKLLASEAAISLENIRLYGELQEREAKVRRLVDANIIGIFIGDFQGRVMEANEAFLRIVGYSREDLLAGRVNWWDLTPPEWRGATERGSAEAQATGAVQAYEKEYLHKDGHRVPVMIGCARFEGRRNEGVAFVLDLTERKRAEREISETELRYREAQMKLAHANRIATMGQMSASIAHEINQPVAATVTNAQAALRFLDGQQPNIEEVRLALKRIVRLGNRVGEVIGRIRALVRKQPPRKDDFEINEAIREVISLSRAELLKNGVSVRSRFAQGLPFAQADRVQLQQVVLNLLMNAVEAMSSLPEGPRELHIRTSNPGSDEILVEVLDSGPGVDPANPERVFEPFYSTKPEGLGIGLAVCRSIIEAHEGRLWAAASELGGATFAFTLPAHRS